MSLHVQMTLITPLAFGYGIGSIINAQWLSLAVCAAVIAYDFRIYRTLTKDSNEQH